MNRQLLIAFGLLVITRALAQEALPPIPLPAPLPPPPPLPKAFVHLDPEAEAPVPSDWPAVEYAEVRAYLYNPGEDRNNGILLDGKLHPDVANPEGIKLSAEQVAQLKQAMRHREPDGRGVGCFLPHHGIVFYDREGKPVADISVCFLCDLVAENPSHRTLLWDMAALAKLIKDLGLPVFKDFDEVEPYFAELARKWPDAKLKSALDECIFRKPGKSTLDDHGRIEMLAKIGERTHPFLLAYLADKNRRAEWLAKADPADPFSRSPFHTLCDLFGDTPPAAAVPLLAGFLEESDESIRKNAALTIAKTGAAEIVPLVRKAFADPEEYVAVNALEGLLVVINRGALHAEAKAQLFDDVKALEEHGHDHQRWAKVLLGLDSNKAMAVFLAKDIFNVDSDVLPDVLTTLAESTLQLPRDSLLGLVREFEAAGSERVHLRVLEPALLLLGRQRHADDLALLNRLTKGKGMLAHAAMPGLLAWHGLEGYRLRLADLEEAKGYAALDESQRHLIAVDEFDSTTMAISDYFSGDGAAHWRDALAGLKATHQDELAEILVQSVAKFGEKGPPGDEAALREQLRLLEGQHAFAELDQRREEAAEHASLALDRFAIEHAGSFK